MTSDLLLGLFLGACIAAVMFVKALSWALLKAVDVVTSWVNGAL